MSTTVRSNAAGRRRRAFVAALVAGLGALLAITQIDGAATPSPASSTGAELDARAEGASTFADFDADGCLDLVSNTYSSSSWTRLLRGSCDGGSVTYADVTATHAPGLAEERTGRSAVWGDLDRDGDVDLVVNHWDWVDVYLNAGATGGYVLGELAGPSLRFDSLTGGANTEGIGLADVDGDGDLDIVVENQGGVDVLVNDGAAGFTLADRSATGLDDGSTGDWLAVGDVDTDGDIDLVVRKQGSDDLFRNAGDGSFAAEAPNLDDANQSSVTDKSPVILCDVDLDGDLDVGGELGGELGFLVDDGAGSFGGAATVTLDVPGQLSGAVCTDLDLDGRPDVVVASTEALTLFTNTTEPGDPVPTFAPAETLQASGVLTVTAADVDGDLDRDLYAVRDGDPNVLYLNDASAPAFAVRALLDNGPTTSLALGATIRVTDCDGQLLGALHDVNGGSGRGTQGPPDALVGTDVARVVVSVRYPHGPIVEQVVDAAAVVGTTVEIRDTDTGSDDCSTPPVVVDDVVEAVEDAASFVLDLTANDTDDSDLTVTRIDPVALGTFDVTGPAPRFVPAANANGSASTEYEVCDTDPIAVSCSTGTLSVTLTAIDDPPVTSDDVATTDASSAVVVDVTANDDDVDSDLSDATVVIDEVTGAATASSDGGEITVVPQGFATTVTVVHQVCVDDSCSPGVLTVAVDGDGPTSPDAAVYRGGALVIDVAGNDAAAVGERSIVVAEPPVAGTVECSTTCTYTPDTSFVGTDRFEYELRTDTGTYAGEVVVAVPNLAPVLDEDDPTISTGDEPPDLVATDGNGHRLTYSVTSGTVPDGLSLGTDGRWTGSASDAGSWSFDVTVCDSAEPAACTTTPYRITVVPTTATDPPDTDPPAEGPTPDAGPADGPDDDPDPGDPATDDDATDDPGGDPDPGGSATDDDATDDDGTNDDGTNDDGTNDDGTNDDGTNDDGTNDDGTDVASGDGPSPPTVVAGDADGSPPAGDETALAEPGTGRVVVAEVDRSPRLVVDPVPVAAPAFAEPAAGSGVADWWWLVPATAMLAGGAVLVRSRPS